MHILLRELAWIGRVLFSCEADKSIVVHVNPERVETRHEHIDAQIVLQPIDQVRVRDVL